ncbi:MAG: LamG-like jellyroll fold domain-containing protein, partial [Nitrospirota bacterium]
MEQFKTIQIIVCLVNLLLFFGSAYAQAPTQGLIAYWAFNEGSGSTAQDSTGNNNTGTLNNGPLWVPGREGSALSFDGLDDYVQINDSNSLDLTGGAFTISAWIYPETFGENLNGRIIDHGGGSEGIGGWSLLVNNYQNGSNVRLSTKDDSIGKSFYSNTGSVHLTTWQHIAVSMNSGTVKFYVNGQTAGQASWVPVPIDRNDPVRIGMRVSDMLRAFAGTIDEVRVYDRALTSAEVFLIYNQSPVSPPVISDGQPAGVLPSGTTSVTLSVTTDKTATCKYSIYPDLPYSQMQDTFSSTGGTTHTNPISDLEDNDSRTFYVKCRSLAGDSNTTDYTVSFSIGRNVYHVSPAGSDSAPGTAVLPMKTVQRAIDSARRYRSGATVIKVAQGTYYESIDIVCCSSQSALGNLLIQGGWTSDFTFRNSDPSVTAIDGKGKYRAIMINVPSFDLTIEGMTIRNGFNSGVGGGIFVIPFSQGNITLNLISNIISHNKAGSGGGVYIFSKEQAVTTLTLSGNVIVNNSAEKNCGGVCVISEDASNTALTLNGNTIVDNSAGYEGGGIYVRAYNGASITSSFVNNSILHNSAAYFGAGLYAYSESGASLSADFAGNRISGNTGPYFGGGVCLYSVSNSAAALNFTDNTISGNTASMHGGGIHMVSASGAAITSTLPNINNNITDNTAGNDGGGIFSWGTAALTFTNSMITGNTAYRGGGIFTSEGTALTLTNNTITGNNADHKGGGIYALHCSQFDLCCIPGDAPDCGTATHAASSGTSVNIINTIVYGNTASNDGNGIYILSAYDLGAALSEVNASYSDIDVYVNNTVYPGTYNDLGNNMSAAPLV